MRSKPSKAKKPAEQVVKDIRRATRRHFSAEDKIRIVLDGLRGEDSIAELCRKEGIAQSLYYTWSKEFMEAGKRRLAGDTAEVFLYQLERLDGDVIDFKALRAAKLVPSTAKRAKIVKRGELSKKLSLKGVLATAGARAAIEAAGGSVEEA